MHWSAVNSDSGGQRGRCKGPKETVKVDGKGCVAHQMQRVPYELELDLLVEGGRAVQSGAGVHL